MPEFRHNQAAKQVMETSPLDLGVHQLPTGAEAGKQTMLNSFCIGDRSNGFCNLPISATAEGRKVSFDFMPSRGSIAWFVTNNVVRPVWLARCRPLHSHPPGFGSTDPVDLAKVAVAA